MSGTVVTALGIVVGVLGIAARLFFWWQGNKNEKAKVNKKDADVLKKQRDNNVYTTSGADAKWVYLRDKYK